MSDPVHHHDCASLQPWTGGMRSMGADECDCGPEDSENMNRDDMDDPEDYDDE